MHKICFKLMVIFLTVFRFIFGFDASVNYDKLPVDFEVESVNDIFVPLPVSSVPKMSMQM